MHLHFHWLRMRTRQKLRLGREFKNPKTENTAMSAKNGRQTAQMSVD